MTRSLAIIAGLALAICLVAAAHLSEPALVVAQMGVTPAPTPKPTVPPHTRPESAKEPVTDPDVAPQPQR